MVARSVVVAVLVAFAGLISLAAAPPDGPAPMPPSPDPLLAGSGWQIETAYAPVVQGLAFQEWSLSQAGGAQAVLFIGATSRPQSVLGWTGELGYLGEGYLVETSSVKSTAVGAQVARITQARIRHGTTGKDIAYSVVRPDGIVASGTDEPFGLAWDAFGHRGASYYAVRVSVPTGTSDEASSTTASSLLTTVLAALVQR